MTTLPEMKVSSILFPLLLLSCFSCVSDSVRPHRGQPSRLPHPWDSPGKNTGVGCHFLLQCMKVKRESEVAQWCPILSDPMDCSLPGSSVHGIERVTGRKARGLQMEEIACKCQTFLSLLSGRRKQTSNIFFLLYTNLKRGFS